MSEEEIASFRDRFMMNDSIVVCSESARTQQTYGCLKGTVLKDKDARIDPNLNEIYFSVIGLVDPGSKTSLLDTRKRLYTAIRENRDCVEPYNSVKMRVEQIVDRYVLDKDNPLCFSHGFFIRLLKSYMDQKGDFDKALDHIGQIPPVPYLTITKPIAF